MSFSPLRRLWSGRITTSPSPVCRCATSRRIRRRSSKGPVLPEFEILVRLTGIALGMGAEADPDQLAGASLMAAVHEAVSNPESAMAGRDPAEILSMLGDRPWPEKFLDLMLRLGHRGDGFGANPEGLSLGSAGGESPWHRLRTPRAPAGPDPRDRVGQGRPDPRPDRGGPSPPARTDRSGARPRNSC